MAEESQNEALCAEYQKLQPVYEQFSLECEQLIEKLLEAADFSSKCHSVTHRSKDQESLEKKLAQEDKHYEHLSEVTDLAGVRIITYFADDVDVVATVIEEEFDVDWENSIDKRAMLDPDRFGYLSLHYVCQHKANRAQLPENAKYGGLKLEIQIRSVLQHAWAEIEHDLGYKNPEAIPALVKRRTFSLAGLLEVGDNEFISIRDDVKKYAERVAGEISRAPDDVRIDKVSLVAFLAEDERALQLGTQMAAYLGRELANENSKAYADKLVVWLTHAGLETIQDVQHALKDEADLMMEHLRRGVHVKRSSDARSQESLQRGYVLVYLGLVLHARRGDVRYVVEGLERTGMTVTATTFEELAKEAVATLRELEPTG